MLLCNYVIIYFFKNHFKNVFNLRLEYIFLIHEIRVVLYLDNNTNQNSMSIAL